MSINLIVRPFHSKLHLNCFLKTKLFQNSFKRKLVSDSNSIISESTFHEIADETLEELQEILSVIEIQQIHSKYNINPNDIEIAVSQGVLKLDLSSKGTWVINKQTPNRQLWWSSPISGPRRYEYKPNETINSQYKYINYWKYTKDNSLLIDTLRDEIFISTGLDINKKPNI